MIHISDKHDLTPPKSFNIILNFLYYIEMPTSTNNYKRLLQNDLSVIIYMNKMNIENDKVSLAYPKLNMSLK